MVQARSFFIKQDATSGQGSSTTGDVENIAGKHLAAGVLFSCSFPDTSCGAEAGCWAHSLWPHVAVFVYDLGVSNFVSSQNCLAHVRASLFLADVSSCHAEILPPTLLCLHRTFRRRSGTSSLWRVLSFPADHNKDAIWLVIQAPIFCSTFFGRNIIFADNLSSGQNLSVTLLGMIDDFLELVLQGSLLNAASSRDSAEAVWGCKRIAYTGSLGAALC